MFRCKRCVLPSTRPDTQFVDGVCSGCLSYERRPQIDWDARKQELMKLLERHDGQCIVPSSGGKDSHYQVLALLELGAEPTIVTATTCQLTRVGRMNIDNLGHYAPTYEISPNKAQRAKLNRLGLEMVGDISWPEHVAIFTMPFRMAAHLEIPLMFYGENPQSQYGGPLESQDARQMTRRWVSEFGGFLGLRPNDVEGLAGPMDLYKPPPAHVIEKLGIEAHFLGQYLPWDSHRNADIATLHGFTFQRPCHSNWWAFENQDNAQTGIHDYLCYRKYGFGRADAQLSVDIRAGKITRQTAIAWLKAYRNEFPEEYMGVPYQDVLDQIGVPEQRFWVLLDQFTNWEIFRRVEDDIKAEPMLLEELYA